MDKIKIRKICCNNYVVHAISEKGKVYSWGNDLDKSGILGLGNIFIKESPIINMNFNNHWIINMSISEKHGAALDSIF